MEEGGGRKKKEKKKGKGRRRRKKGRRCLRRHVLFRCRRLLLRVHVPPTPKVYEPSRSGCRPSRHLCVDGLCAGIVDVWAIVPQMWTSTIVAAFSCRFWKPPRIGEVLPNFSSNSDVFLLLQSRSYRRGPGAPRRSRSSSSALRSCLHCFVSPLHRLATASLAFLHRHPRYN